ncbi:MAG: phosphatidate cytidylyltransferase [Chromatiales bacterium]
MLRVGVELAVSSFHVPRDPAELSVRVLTAAALITGVLSGLWWLPVNALAALLGVIALLGAWEWTAMAGCKPRSLRYVYVAATSLAMAVLYYFLDRESVQTAVWWVGAAWWVMAAWLVVRYQTGGPDPQHGQAGKLAAGWLILLPAWAALVVLAGNGPWEAVVLMLLVWIADSAAYLYGRRFGRHRLASRVSPGKSWEGFIAALLTAAVVAFVVAGSTGSARLAFVALGMVTVLFSVIGDLAESLYKRLAGMKDSGSMLPGHGGVLDRIDSLTAAAPVFALGMAWLEGTS